MTFVIYYLSIVFSMIFIAVVVSMVRKNRLQERYAILWCMFAVGIIILSAFPQIILKTAELVGVKYAPALMFLVGFLFIIVYILKLTEMITKNEKKIIKLAQELAILKGNKRENKENTI